MERARPYFLCLLGGRYGWSQPIASSSQPTDDLLAGWSFVSFVSYPSFKTPLSIATFERAARKYPWIARLKILTSL